MPSEDLDTADCARCGEPLDAHDEDTGQCPVEAAGKADEDENDEQSSEEIRANAQETLADAHAAAVVCVTFPREDNDLDEVDPMNANFILSEELSYTELLATKKVLDEGVDMLQDDLESMEESRSRPTAMAIPTTLGQLLGGGSGSEQPDPEGWGFQ